MEIQATYGCGLRTVDAAITCYKERVSREEDAWGDVGAPDYMHHKVKRAPDGSPLEMLSEDEVATHVAAVRASWPTIGVRLMMFHLRSLFPTMFFSKYVVARVVRERDASRRVRWPTVLQRGNIWSPHAGYSWHIDGNEKAIHLGLHITGCVDACTGAVLWIKPLCAKRGELLVAAAAQSIASMAFVLPVRARTDECVFGLRAFFFFFPSRSSRSNTAGGVKTLPCCAC